MNELDKYPTVSSRIEFDPEKTRCFSDVCKQSELFKMFKNRIINMENNKKCLVLFLSITSLTEIRSVCMYFDENDKLVSEEIKLLPYSFYYLDGDFK